MQPLYKTAHTHVVHYYFLYFLLRCKTKKVLALFPKPGPKAVPVPSRHYDPVHCLSSLCRVRTENSLAVGKGRKGTKKPQTNHHQNTNKMPQTKNHKPVTQNKILFCSRFTAQQEIFMLACRQVGAKQDSFFISVPEGV